jgi:hypothetical protein
MSSSFLKLSEAPAGGSSRLLALANKVFLNRSVAIIWWTGLAALMAAFRLASDGSASEEEMFRTWMIDWALIWVALAALGLRLLKPVLDYVVSDQNAHAEASMLRELSRVEPNFAQELRSMTMHQQMRDEQAAEEALATQEALAALGGVRAEVASGAGRKAVARA